MNYENDKDDYDKDKHDKDEYYKDDEKQVNYRNLILMKNDEFILVDNDKILSYPQINLW